MPVLLLLARVKVTDGGNLRKEIEGKLKNPEENPGQILWELLDSWLKILWEATFGSVVKVSANFIDSVTCCPIDKLCLSYFDVNGSSLDASHQIQAGFAFSKWTKGKLSKRGDKRCQILLVDGDTDFPGGRGTSLIVLQQVTTSTWHTLASLLTIRDCCRQMWICHNASWSAYYWDYTSATEKPILCLIENNSMIERAG